MGFFDSFKRSVKTGANTLSGNKDFLEAVCAASALVVYADGSASEEEIEAAIAGMSNNKVLGAAYSPQDIEDELNKQLKKATTVSGRMGLKREIQDVTGKDSNSREDVFLIAADVAYADGSVGDKERQALNSIAALVGVDATKLLAA